MKYKVGDVIKIIDATKWWEPWTGHAKPVNGTIGKVIDVEHSETQGDFYVLDCHPSRFYEGSIEKVTQ